MVITALIVGLPPTILAFASLIQSIRNGAKSDVIAGHVNSAASAQVAKINGLEQEVRQMRAEMADRKEIAAVLAAKVPEAK
jgi:hypothetical protein